MGGALQAPSSARDILRSLQAVGLCTNLDASTDRSVGLRTNLDASTNQSVGLRTNLEASSDQSVGLRTNLDASTGPSELTFDRVLSAFYKDLWNHGGVSSETLPLPAVVGEGRPVDLLALFALVKARGGYKAVTVARSWPAVARSAGFGPTLGPAVKLIYAKYLRLLERWAQNIPEKSLNLSPGEVGSEGRVQNGHSAKNGEVLPVLKRKRGEIVGMLNWLRAVAKKPCDLSYKINSCLKDAKCGKSNSTADNFRLGLIMRKEMFVKKIRKDCSVEAPKQKTLQYSPQSQNKGKKTRASARLNSTSAPAVTPGTGHIKLCNKSVPPLIGWLSLDEESDIPVGPDHQADIPEFTNYVNISDSNSLKYLGTSLWSPKHKTAFQENHTPMVEIGCSKKTCQCSIPGSPECIRFHVAENRLKLKRELGSVFYGMGFHKMGEEVALSWTEEEENKFKSIICANLPSNDKKFWPPLFAKLRRKGWKGLVSYYYNVFLLRRRRYQNRAVPDEIDSDDDDIELEFLNGDLYLNTVCAENRQCVDLDP